MKLNILKDLRGNFGPARDQKQRPTCTAFAASDAHSVARGGVFEALSPEFAFFYAHKSKAIFDPTRGLSMEDIMGSISSIGQPLEDGWPYLDKLPDDLGSYTPPQQTHTLYKRDAVIEKAFANLTSRLDDGRCVVLGLEISAEFYRPPFASSIKAPVDSPLVGKHAVIAVGHGVEAGAQVFLIRNSWGETWGEKGYAWISRHYLEPRIISLGAFAQ
jgi:Papain family cysteine protease